MTTSKIRIKLGAIEVEYEGSESFLKEELPQLLEAVSDLYAKSNVETTASGDASAPKAGPSGAKIQMTTGSVAAKLQVKSGPELVLAAVARSTFVLGQDVVSRQTIIDEMRSATAYYKPSYTSNLSPTLAGLLKDGKVNEPSKGNFALTAQTKTELERRLV